jgi:hypothetical protein
MRPMAVKTQPRRESAVTWESVPELQLTDVGVTAFS